MNVEDEKEDHDQMPVAKKYEMLGDRDPNKLKLELEGGTSEKKSQKKNSSHAETNTETAIETDVTTDNKEVLDVVIKKEKEDMETSNTEITAEEPVELAVENVTNVQSVKEENATTKDNLTVAYDPNVAIGKR